MARAAVTKATKIAATLIPVHGIKPTLSSKLRRCRCRSAKMLITATTLATTAIAAHIWKSQNRLSSVSIAAKWRACVFLARVGENKPAA